MSLTECQQKALAILNSPNNVFLTGVAGAGKSYLLQQFLKEKDPKTHRVVASTGAAAVLVGGVTFHSFFGLGIMEGGLERTVKRALDDKRLKRRLRKTQLVVIDEVSMIPGLALKAAESISRKLRDNGAPWGGMKIVAVGDFGQLPPVNTYGTAKDWAFKSEAWLESSFQVAYLNTIVRTEDRDFLRVLNFVREGEVNEEVTQFLNSRMKSREKMSVATHVFPHRRSVEDYNIRELDRLPGEVTKIETIYDGEGPYLEAIRKSAPVPETLYLKNEALIMIRKNDPKLRYVNGTLGKIKKISSDIIEVELLNGLTVEIEPETFSYMNSEGEPVAAATNFPINLAWATTIHKCQGMTLDCAVMDLSRVFEEGQAYVALSRVRSPEGLFIAGWSPNGIRASGDVRAFHQSLS